MVFKVGFSTVCLKSTLPNVASNLLKFYPYNELLTGDDFVDFFVTLDCDLIRRWYKPQVNFSFDGHYPFKPLPQDQAFAMFEWSFNWVIAHHSHQYLVIHSAVLEKNGKALIFPGTPGSGKSTLCAALVGRGWRLLSDEMALVDRVTGLLQPIPRPISLKNESIGIIKEFVPEFAIGEPVKDTAKGTVAHVCVPESSVLANDDLVYPSAVIFPKYKNDVDTTLIPITKGVGFMNVAENSFNYNVLGEQGFDALSSLVDRCDFYEFEYQNLDEAIALFNEMVS
ncbi:MAG: HprK-related kinase A [Piscirickettsiaceae bacterium]|nr:MAG: HprK-related kinase A [Piscirickettsiaceae bacterium]